jgi:photosystem II stability/assembly factor-like uncharacterized protein
LTPAPQLFLVASLGLLLASCGAPTAPSATTSPSPATAAPSPSPSGPPIITSSDLGPQAAAVCATPTTCVVVGTGQNNTAVIFVSTNSGHSWTKSAIPPGLYPLRAVTCPSAQVCIATGGGQGSTVSATSSTALFSHDGGASWQRGTVPNGIAGLDRLSCPSPTFCLAIGGSFAANGFVGGVVASTGDGGATWTRLSDLALSAFTCNSLTHCVAIAYNPQGQQTLVSNNAGTAWKTTFLSGDVEPDNDSDDSWGVSNLPGSINGHGPGIYISGLACPSPTRCVLVGNGTTGAGAAVTLLLQSDNSGASWRETNIPTSVAYRLGSVACPTSTRCISVGGESSGQLGTVLYSTNGGIDWTVAHVPAGAGYFSGISCWTDISCIAVVGPVGFSGTNPGSGSPASGVYFTSDAGGTWTAS